MPTTMRGRPSSVTVLPTTAGSEPNRFCHAAQERSATSSRPFWSSSSVKLRPKTGRTPSASKKVPVAYPTETRSARSGPCSAAVYPA